MERTINFKDSDDWFRFVCFYTFNNYQNAAYRLYNYLTIYGFLRNMCFVFSIAFWVSLVSTVDITNATGEKLQLQFGWSGLYVALACALSAIILFFSFLKFYRRYTEEAILAFATRDDSLEQKPSKK